MLARCVFFFRGGLGVTWDGLGFADPSLTLFLNDMFNFELQRGMSDDTTVSIESHIYCQVSSHLHVITSSRKNGLAVLHAYGC